MPMQLQQLANVIYDIILLTPAATSVLAYVIYHVIACRRLCHHSRHLSDVIASLVDFDR